MVFIEDETIAKSSEYQCRDCSKAEHCDDIRGLQWDGCIECELTQEGKKRIILERIAADEARQDFFSVLITRVDEILSEITMMQTAMRIGRKSPDADTALSLAIQALQLAQTHMN